MQNTMSQKALKYILKLQSRQATTEVTMPLRRSDYEQSARYIEYACELLERQAFAQTIVIREVLQLAVRRLSPVADKVKIADAHTGGRLGWNAS